MEKNGEMLRKLGIWPNLGGYHYLAYGLTLARREPERLRYVTKELYPEIARQYQTNWLSVERAIRTAVKTCWERGNRDLLNEMVGYRLQDKPTASEFIAITAEYLGTEKDRL